MTCIIGLLTDEGFHMGGDRFSIQEAQLRLRSDTKIFRRNFLEQAALIGFAGSYYMGQALRNFKWNSFLRPADMSTDGLLEELVRIFIPVLMKYLSDLNCLKRDDDGKKIPGEILIGLHKRMLTIGNDFQIAMYNDTYTAIGGAKKYALGALCILTSLGYRFADGNDIVEASLNAAYKFDTRIRPPFTIDLIETSVPWKI